MAEPRRDELLRVPVFRKRIQGLVECEEVWASWNSALQELGPPEGYFGDSRELVPPGGLGGLVPLQDVQLTLVGPIFWMSHQTGANRITPYVIPFFTIALP